MKQLVNKQIHTKIFSNDEVCNFFSINLLAFEKKIKDHQVIKPNYQVSWSISKSGFLVNIKDRIVEFNIKVFASKSRDALF